MKSNENEKLKNNNDDYNVYGSKLKDVKKIKELEEENRELKELIGELILKAIRIERRNK